MITKVKRFVGTLVNSWFPNDLPLRLSVFSNNITGSAMVHEMKAFWPEALGTMDDDTVPAAWQPVLSLLTVPGRYQLAARREQLSLSQTSAQICSPRHAPARNWPPPGHACQDGVGMGWGGGGGHCLFEGRYPLPNYPCFASLTAPEFFLIVLFFCSCRPPPPKIKISQCKIVYKRDYSIKHVICLTSHISQNRVKTNASYKLQIEPL